MEEGEEERRRGMRRGGEDCVVRGADEDCLTEVYVFALGQCSGHRGGIALDRGRGDEAAALHQARQLAGGGGRGREESGSSGSGEEK